MIEDYEISQIEWWRWMMDDISTGYELKKDTSGILQMVVIYDG